MLKSEELGNAKRLGAELCREEMIRIVVKFWHGIEEPFISKFFPYNRRVLYKVRSRLTR